MRTQITIPLHTLNEILKFRTVIAYFIAEVSACRCEWFTLISLFVLVSINSL